MSFGSRMVGTRNAPTQSLNTASAPTRSVSQSLTRDVGMSKNVTASITFVGGGTNQLQAANGTFSAFVASDIILVEGSALNSGTFQVVAIDAVNHAFLTVANGLKAEGPITCTVRSL